MDGLTAIIITCRQFHPAQLVKTKNTRLILAQKRNSQPGMQGWEVKHGSVATVAIIGDQGYNLRELGEPGMPVPAGTFYAFAGGYKLSEIKRLGLHSMRI